jgi:hypothetical protein
MSRSAKILAVAVVCVLGFSAVWFFQPANAPQKRVTLKGDVRAAAVRPVTLASAVRTSETSRNPAVNSAAKNGAAMRLLAEFEENARGDFELNASEYSATISQNGALTYRPQLKDHRESSLTLALESVSRGDSFIARSADEAVSPRRNGRDLEFQRLAGSVREIYSPRGEGVEQQFVMNALPVGSGDVRLTFTVASDGLTAAAQRAGRNGGISFLAPDGSTAVRYGQVVVRDAAGRGISIEPRLDDASHLSFALPERWLRTAALPVVIDPLVGNNIGISSDSTVSNTVAPPAITSGATSSLITWVDYSAGADFPVLGASILSASGLASSPFVISDPLGRPRPFRFQRTYSATDGSNWLVVWSDDRAPGNGIRGTLISSTGTILGGTDFLISSTRALIEEDPLVAFNGVDFVVAWQDVPAQAASGTQVFFTRVTTAGVVAGATALPTDISPQSQILEFLAPQLPSGDTLLLYRENAETPAQTRGTRIATDGTLRDPGGTSLFKENLADNGYGRPIGAAFINGSWNILSSYDQTIDSSIFLHKLSTDGAITPPSGKFAEMGLGPTGSAIDLYAPAFAGVSEWLFIRNEKVSNTVFHLLGKRVAFDGTDKDPVPFQIDTATQGAVRSAVAVQQGNFFAVAWLDGRSGATQLADGVEIIGALIDTTSAATTGTPLIAAVNASPTSGEAPLTVSFSPTLSSGTYDTLTWVFGDGLSSTEAQVLHTYKNNGSFVAQLILTKGAYSVYDTVLIRVGTGVSSGAATQIGVPATNSADMVPSLFIQSFGVNLNFAKTGTDSVLVSGILDAGSLPSELAGVLCNVAIGTYSASFSIDTNGSFKSDVSKSPVTTFAVNPDSGAFLFEVTNADLVATLDALGAHNETVNLKDNRIIMAPISVTVGGFSASAKAGFQYRAVKDNTGAGSYIFQSTGDEVSGSFLVTKFSAKESVLKKVGTKVHSFTLTGQLIAPNAAAIVPDPTGSVVASIGGYSNTLSGAQFTAKKGTVKFAGKKITSGLSSLSIAGKGKLTAKFVGIDAAASGMPLANSGDNILKVDLNFSLQFALSGGGQLNAGRFVPTERADAAAKSWILRGVAKK